MFYLYFCITPAGKHHFLTFSSVEICSVYSFFQIAGLHHKESNQQPSWCQAWERPSHTVLCLPCLWDKLHIWRCKCGIFFLACHVFETNANLRKYVLFICQHGIFFFACHVFQTKTTYEDVSPIKMSVWHLFFCLPCLWDKCLMWRCRFLSDVSVASFFVPIMSLRQMPRLKLQVPVTCHLVWSFWRSGSCSL